VGYTGSFLPVLVGYYLLRKYKPNARRPFRLPEFMKYVALAIALFYGVVWLYGGLVYSELGNAKIYFYLGWLVLLSYLPFYWYRTRIEDPKVADGLAKPQFAAGPSTPIHSK
jgi:amino acid transporter